jgi:hypothetical protein
LDIFVQHGACVRAARQASRQLCMFQRRYPRVRLHELGDRCYNHSFPIWGCFSLGWVQKYSHFVLFWVFIEHD